MRPTWAGIHLDHLAQNFKHLKQRIGSNCEYLAVVKANAYGHGAVPCAQVLERSGIDWFGVAIPEEAIELRQAGIRKPILCLGGFWEGQESEIIRSNITPAIFLLESAVLVDRAARNLNTVVPIHLKVDTGMGRVGIRLENLSEFADRIRELKNLRVEGLMSHFASADDPSEDDYTNEQLNRFDQAYALLSAKGFQFTYRDLANSPAAIRHPASRQSMVRIGGLLYGLYRDILPKDLQLPELRPVLSLQSKIAFIKDVPPNETLGYGRSFRTKRPSRIATVPIGYHDGYPRALSNQSTMIVNGAFANVVGRVSMDWTLIDVTDIPSASVDSNVTIIGIENDLSVTAEELASYSQTISYELTCGISPRVHRKIIADVT